MHAVSLEVRLQKMRNLLEC